MFHKINAVVLFVHDFDKCLRFYRDTLGLEVGLLEPSFVAFKMDGHDFALQEIAAAEKMFGVKGEIGHGDRTMLCARVADVDAAYATLTAKGVEFTKPPTDQYWGIRAAYFRDPEGNFWEILQSIAAQPTE